MFKLSQYFACLTTAALLSLAIPSGIAGLAHADPTEDSSAEENSPAEMLQDGLEALIERQTELATELFEQVIKVFPGTPEAKHAERELDKLADAKPDDAEPVPNRNSISNDYLRFSTKELRMKFAVDVGDRVFFAENSAVIGGRARSLLEHQAHWLVKRPDLKITIVGRADEGNSAEAAREISTQRAEAVRDRLVAHGVAASRIAIEARGMRDPVATCRSALCQAENRHAETVIGTSAAADISGRAATVSQ
mgnify:CR=1 FL=1